MFINIESFLLIAISVISELKKLSSNSKIQFQIDIQIEFDIILLLKKRDLYTF